jgi:cyclohexadieny/prephenate dehydrogenase
MHIPTLTIVGVGLLGGSIALAAKGRRLVGRIVGCDRSEKALACGVERGMLDETTTDLCRAVANTTLAVFCTPVDQLADTVAACAGACKPGTLLTDVGSTKTGIVRRLAGRMPPGVNFVGSHPLAGSEKAGPENARADLFDNRLVVLTPIGDPPAAVWTIGDFWRALGARVETMSPEKHDEVLATTSHLPHLLASVLAGVLPLDWRAFTATGFRDTTRLAAGSPELWQAIFLSNQPALLEAIGRFQGHLDLFREAIARGEGTKLRILLEQGKYVRDSLSQP